MPRPGVAARVSIALPGVRAAALSFMRGGAATPINPTQAETTALLAAMTVQPDAARQNLINDLIFALKNAGLWTTFDFFLVFAAHDQQAARVGWINPARIVTSNGATTFTVDRGYNGDGVSAYLGLGTNLDALTKFTQNNGCMGVWCPNNSQGGSMIGLPTTQRLTLQPRSNVDTLATRFMSASQAQGVASVDPRGHTCLNRTAAAGYDRYKNGAVVDNVVGASLAVIAEEVVFVRNVATYASQPTLALAHGGSALTAPQIANLYGIINAYMTGVGAV
jgi:hypothetical protein